MRENRARRRRWTIIFVRCTDCPFNNWWRKSLGAEIPEARRPDRLLRLAVVLAFLHRNRRSIQLLALQSFRHVKGLFRRIAIPDFQIEPGNLIMNRSVIVIG